MAEATSDYYTCKIKDLFLASYLQSLGFQMSIVASEEDDQQLIEFDFGDLVSQEAVLSYFNSDFVLHIDGKDCSISPRKLFLTFRDLRNRVNAIRMKDK